MFPSPVIESNGISQSLGDGLPSWLQFGNLCGFEWDRRDSKILVHCDEILIPVHHQL